MTDKPISGQWLVDDGGIYDAIGYTYIGSSQCESASIVEAHNKIVRDLATSVDKVEPPDLNR